MDLSDLLVSLVKFWATQVPMLFLCVIGGAIVIDRLAHAPESRTYALLGLVLSLLLCIVIPIVHQLVSRLYIQGSDVSSRIWVYTALSTLWSALHAVATGLLLAAVFANHPAASHGSRLPKMEDA